MDYHDVTKKITNQLSIHHCWFETFEHEPVLTSEEAAKIRIGYTLHQGAKAIIAKAYYLDNTDRFVLFVLPGDCKLDTKKVKAAIHIKKFRFASPDELAQITGGLLTGAVPPFGGIFNLQTYVDKKLLDNEKIVFNAGDRRFSVGMLLKDYLSEVDPQILDLSEDNK